MRIHFTFDWCLLPAPAAPQHVEMYYQMSDNMSHDITDDTDDRRKRYHSPGPVSDKRMRAGDRDMTPDVNIGEEWPENGVRGIVDR